MLPVQGNVYMLVADGINITVVGRAGGRAAREHRARRRCPTRCWRRSTSWRRRRVAPPRDEHAASARTVPARGAGPARTSTRSSARPAPPRPLRYIINTSAAAEHVGGNEKIADRGLLSARRRLRRAPWPASGSGASIIAHENVLNRHERAGRQAGAGARRAPGRPTPTSTSSTSCPTTSTAKAVIVYHAPAANTDGDSIVFFRRSEVISAGNLFSTVSYPVIDRRQGRQHPGRASPGLNQSSIWRWPSTGRRAAPGSFRAAAGCRTRPTSRRTATC